MTDHVIDHATPRLGSIDRYSPAVLLSLALLFGLLAQALFYRSALGINVGISAIVILAAAYRLRPSGARIDRLDRWIAPSAVVFGLLPALRVDLMLLLFDVPAAFVLVTMAVVSFSGVPLTRRAADLLVILGLVVVGRIVAGGALLLAVRPDRHRTRLPVPPRIRASLRECGRRLLERGRQRFRLPQMVDRRADRPHASRRNLHVGRGRPLPPRGARGRNDDVPGPAAASRSAELNSRRHNAHRGGCAFCLLCRAPDRVSLRRDRHLERDRPLVLDVRAPRLLRAHRGGRACRRPPLRG